MRERVNLSFIIKGIAVLMNQTGIYEQIITNLITGRLNKEQFYIGERVLEQAEAAIWLSRFLSRIIEYAVNCLPAGDDQLQRQIELSNQLILWLKDRVREDEFFDENLLAGQGKYLRLYTKLKILLPPI